MDHNTATTYGNSNHQNNQLLLNAIKNKFDAHAAADAVSFSPPEFNIPLLKIPKKVDSETKSSSNSSVDNQSSQSSKYVIKLKNSLLNRVQEKLEVDAKPAEFTWPQLQTATNSNVTLKFELPVLKSEPGTTNVCSLTKAIEKLNVQENYSESTGQLKQSKSTAIDLSSALATKLPTPTRDFVKLLETKNKLDFKIPFIDCDRPDLCTKQKIILPTSNEYCVTDISQLLLHHSLTEPSAIGRLLSICDNKYLGPLPIKCLSPEYRQQSAKYNIKTFLFDTKSPDDLVLLSLSKYQRPHYN